MKIGGLARAVGISTSAIRYYEAEGLIPKAARSGGKREFDLNSIDLVLLIRLAQRAGFTIAEIKTLISGFSDEKGPSGRWKSMAALKIKKIDEKIKTAEAMKKILFSGIRCKCLKIEDCDLLISEKHKSPSLNCQTAYKT